MTVFKEQPVGNQSRLFHENESDLIESESWTILENFNNSLIPDLMTPDLMTPGSIPLQFREMSMNSRNCVIAYTCLFILAIFGNLSVLYCVLRQIFSLKVKTRITLLILHLSIADLIVTLFLIPMEIFWRISIQWHGGNFLCKLCQFLRPFGLYLSSMVIISISVDRYLAVNHPLRMNGKTVVKYMLTGSWVIAIICSLPQAFVFSVKSHPVFTTFQNCVSIGYFQTPEEEILYNVFSIVVMYFAPLLVIIVTYSLILRKIMKKSKEHQQILESVTASLSHCGCHLEKFDNNRERTEATTTLKSSGSLPISISEFKTPNSGSCKCSYSKTIIKKTSLQLRRSDNGSIVRARNKTLRLTLIIVITFLICSTPYIFMVLWYMFDREGAKLVDEQLQDILFMMAVGNSCANPIIYGSYTTGCNIFCGFTLIKTFFRRKSQISNQCRSEATAITIVTQNYPTRKR